MVAGRILATAGRLVPRVAKGVGGIAKVLDPEEAARLLRSGRYPKAQIDLAQTRPGYRPRPFAEGGANETLATGTRGNWIPRQEFPEAVNSLKASAEERGLLPATLQNSGQLELSNPQHRVLKDPERALEELHKVNDYRLKKVQEYEEQLARLEADFATWQKDGSTPLLRKNGRPASNQKGSYTSAIDAARRLANDWRTFAPEKYLEEWIGDLAKSGYGAAEDLPGGAISGQGPLKGKLDEIVEQHHGFGNQEGADMMKQTAFMNEVFKMNVWQYIAQEYKTALGKSRANMWNIPGTIHRGEKVGLHAWLTQMGFNDYWKKLLKQNPNMSQDEIMNAIDIYFEQVFYPSLVHVENLLLGAKVKHTWKGLHLPKEVLKDAKSRLADLLDRVDTWEPVTFSNRSPVVREQALENLMDAAQDQQASAAYAWSPPDEGPAAREVMTRRLELAESGVKTPF